MQLLSAEEPIRRSISGELPNIVKNREVLLEVKISRLLSEKEETDAIIYQIKSENVSQRF